MYMPLTLQEAKSFRILIWLEGVMVNPLQVVIHYKLVRDQSQERQTVGSVTHLSANVRAISE